MPNFNNTTPLMAAAGLGTTEPLEEAGEEPEALEAVKMLLDLGANVNAVDNSGDTAMHGAAYAQLPACREAAGRPWSRSADLEGTRQSRRDAAVRRRRPYRAAAEAG